MAENRELKVTLTGDDKLKPVLEGAVNETKSAYDKIRAQAGEGGGLSQYAKLLIKNERAEGNIALERLLKSPEGLLKLAGGGVAGFAVDLIGKELERSTGEAIKLRNEFKEGKITSGELVLKIAEGIPIIGSFVSAGANFRELITGEIAEQEKANAMLREKKQLIEENTRAEEQYARVRSQLNDQSLARDIKIESIGAGPASRATISNKDEHRQERTRILDELESQTRSLNDGDEKRAEDLKKGRKEFDQTGSDTNYHLALKAINDAQDQRDRLASAALAGLAQVDDRYNKQATYNRKETTDQDNDRAAKAEAEDRVRAYREAGQYEAAAVAEIDEKEREAAKVAKARLDDELKADPSNAKAIQEREQKETYNRWVAYYRDLANAHREGHQKELDALAQTDSVLKKEQIALLQEQAKHGDAAAGAAARKLEIEEKYTGQLREQQKIKADTRNTREQRAAAAANIEAILAAEKREENYNGVGIAPRLGIQNEPLHEGFTGVAEAYKASDPQVEQLKRIADNTSKPPPALQKLFDDLADALKKFSVSATLVDL